MKSTEAKAIEILINNALETQYIHVQDENFSDMSEEDIKEMSENTSKAIEIEHAIHKMLSPEGQKMFSELDNLYGGRLCIESRYMFKRGVIEGLTTFEYLKEVSNCVYLPLMKI